MRTSTLLLCVSLVTGLSVGLVACDSPSTDPNAAEPAKAEPPADDGAKATSPESATAGPPADGDESDDAPPPGVKAPGNLPVRTEAELEAEAKARDACIEDCVAARQAEARGADAIEADCRVECEKDHPIEQVEVVGPPPEAPPLEK